MNTGTFQTGDAINGNPVVTGNNTLTVTQSETANQTVVATLNNIANINIQGLGTAGVTYNGALWSNVGNVTITRGIGADSSNIQNGLVGTVYGISSPTAEILNVDFGSGSNQTFKVAVNGAGSLGANAAIDYNGTETQVNAITLNTTGTNYLTLNGTTSTASVTVTGAGNNVVDMTGANAISASAAVTIDASAATGSNTIDLGANVSAGGVTVLGSTGASQTTLGLVIPALVTLPTITNVEGLQLDLGSNGTLLSSTTNTTITSLTILDVTNGANTNAYNLIGLAGISSIVWGTTGGQDNQGGDLTLTGSGALVETFARQTSAALATGNGLVLGDQALSGYTSLAINTANGIGSTGSFTIAEDGTTGFSIDSTSLTSLSVVNASTGLTTLNTIDGTNSAGTAGLLTSVDFSGVAGSLTVDFDGLSLGTSAVIKGAAGATTITYAAAQGSSPVTVILGNGANSYAVAAAINNNQVITAGNGNNTIDTGTGSDVITVGTGSNDIDAGTGANVISLGAGHLTAGNRNTVDIEANGTTNTVNGFAASNGSIQGDTLFVTDNAIDPVQAATGLQTDWTTASGVTVDGYSVADGLITWLSLGTAVTLALADATNAQASLVAEADFGSFDGDGAYVFVAGSNSYYNTVDDTTGVFEAATLVGVQALGIVATGGGATTGYIVVLD